MGSTHRAGLLAIVTAVGLCGDIEAGSAQTAPGREASDATPVAVSGTVLDAESGLAITAATIAVAPRAAEACGPANEFFVRQHPGLQRTTAGEDGRYRIAVAPGRYCLAVTRIGYRGRVVVIQVDRALGSSVSVALDVAPLELTPVTVDVSAGTYDPRSTFRFDSISDVRAIEIHRSETFVPLDVVVLDHPRVLAAGMLGETDVFRALQRSPGVSGKDEFSTNLLIRGTEWDQTRVYFDGLPLFNPFHGGGFYGAIHPDVIGSIALHPGTRSAELGQGTGGLIDIRSRSPGAGGSVRGSGEVSPVAARIGLDGPLQGDRGGWLLGVRRSYWDLLGATASTVSGDEELELDYNFVDVTGRLDLSLGENTSATLSTLWEADRAAGDALGIIEADDAVWGNLAARATLERRAGPLELRTTAGVSRSSATATDSEEGFGNPLDGRRLTTKTDLTVVKLSGSARPGRLRPSFSWAVGYDVELASHRHDGVGPTPHPGAILPDLFDFSQEHAVVAGWIQMRARLGERLQLDGGMRVEGGSSVARAPAVRPAPNLTVRVDVRDDLRVFAGVNRIRQYSQILAPSGLQLISFGLEPVSVSLLSDASVPAPWSNVATAGIEKDFGTWSATVNAFYRRVGHLSVPDPHPVVVGPMTGQEIVGLPDFVSADVRTGGFEENVRRTRGSLLTSLAYSYQASSMEAAGLRFPAPADRRHQLDLVSSYQIPRGPTLRLNFTASSGLPFARSYSFVGEDGVRRASVGAPGDVRQPWYASLDASAEWHWDFDGWTLAVSAQARNLTGRGNKTVYRGSLPLNCVPMDNGFCEPGTVTDFVDSYEQGLLPVPFFGLRFSF